MRMTRTTKIIILILFLLLVGLGVYYFFGSNEKEPELRSGVIEGSLYSCAWEELDKNRLQLEVLGELPDACEWSWINDANAIQVTQQENTAVFTLNALKESIGLFTLMLREKDMPIEKGADITLYISVDSNMRISLNSGSITALNAESFAGEDGVSIYWCESSVGGLFVYLTGTDWRVQSNEGVIYTGPTADGDMVRLEVIPEEGSDAKSLVLIDNATDTGYELRFTQQEGRLNVESCRSVEAEEPKAAEETDPKYEALLEAMAKAETEEEKNRLKARYWLSLGGTGTQSKAE